MAIFIFALDTTMMNVAITALTQDLNTEIHYIQFTIAFYSLVIASCMLLGAKLSSIYGTKRIFIIGVILYGIGTLTAAMSVNVVMLAAGWSVIEGVGAAFMITPAVAFLMTTYRGKERAVAFAIFSAVSIGAASIGPIVGGAFTTYLSWRWAFGMEFLIVVIILVFSRVLINYKKPVKSRLDVTGALLSALGFGCLVFGIIVTTSYGWWEAKRPLVIGNLEIAPFGISIAAILIITGVIFLIFLVLWIIIQDRKGKEPLLPVSLIKNSPYIAGGVVNIVTQLCLAALLFSIPFFLQSVLSQNAMQTGLIVLPLTLAMMVITFLTPRLSSRISVKYIIMCGTAICIVATVLLANVFSAHMNTIALIPGFILFGIGTGLAIAQLQNLTLSAVKPDEVDEGTGLFNAFRNLGASMGTAVVGTLLLTFFLSSLSTGINNSNILPETDKEQLTHLEMQYTKEMERKNIKTEIKNVLGQYPDEYVREIEEITANAVGHSMRVTYYTLAGIFAAGFVIAIFLPKRKFTPVSNNNTPPL